MIPPEVRNLTALKTSKSHVTIQWSPPVYSGFYGIKWFIVDLREFGQDSSLVKDTVKSFVDTYTWTGLDAGTNYKITAFGKNHVGEGIPSVLEIKTLPGNRPFYLTDDSSPVQIPNFQT